MISAMPCPFCGSTYAGKVEVKFGEKKEHTSYRLRCPTCDAQTGIGTTDEILKGYWERRAVQPEGNALTDNDKRWRLLEHGCQWVSWTPTGGETHSFDPRDVGHLKRMRAWADETITKQLALLDKERREIEALLSPRKPT
jgi:hypothetical protein